MTQKEDVCGIIAGHFDHINYRYGGQCLTARASHEEVITALSLMGMEGRVPVVMGSEIPFSTKIPHQQ